MTRRLMLGAAAAAVCLMIMPNESDAARRRCRVRGQRVTRSSYTQTTHCCVQQSGFTTSTCCPDMGQGASFGAPCGDACGSACGPISSACGHTISTCGHTASTCGHTACGHAGTACGQGWSQACGHAIGSDPCASPGGYGSGTMTPSSGSEPSPAVEDAPPPPPSDTRGQPTA
jgi:hypothetical protein